MFSSNLTKSYHLKKNERYYIIVNWNIYNNLWIDNETPFIGKFLYYKYIPCKTKINSNGLVEIIERSKKVIYFKNDYNRIIGVSSNNLFYHILLPPKNLILELSAVNQLKQKYPVELKKYIKSFITMQPKKYRKKKYKLIK